MIRHIFKLIWNERRANRWIFIEYFLVFCVLWICCNFISSIFRTYEAPPGFDISQVYMINMDKNPNVQEDIDNYEVALTLLDRVKRHPNVEFVAMGKGIPFGRYSSWGGMNVNDNDSIRYLVKTARVTSDFFNVFQIPLTSGEIFDWQDEGNRNTAVISAFKKDLFGGGQENLIPIYPIHKLIEQKEEEDLVINVAGTTGRIVNSYSRFEDHVSTVFLPLPRQETRLPENDIVIRVKQDTRKDFPYEFIKDMKEQLSIGTYFLASIKPIEEIKNERSTVVLGKLNSIYAVAFFLIVNIFLGILGTFWFRVQSRRSEIGLRLAVGSSKKMVQKIFIYETFFLLLPASIIGTVICVALFGGALLDILGIPAINREIWKIGREQDMINFVLTFGFLAIVSIAAVLYPANRAANIQPAETLREE